VHLALHQQPHRHGRGVPSARDQLAEEGALRCLFVQVERLRIELRGERLDAVSRHGDGAGTELLSHLEVFEESLRHVFPLHPQA
jgi:hypothetical protein